MSIATLSLTIESRRGRAARLRTVLSTAAILSLLSALLCVPDHAVLASPAVVQKSSLINPNVTSSNHVFALRSKANNKFVVAENAGQSPLIANRTAIGPWERFELIRTSSTDIQLRAGADGQFVCADVGGASPLISNRDVAGPWETFELLTNTDGTVSLRARANGRFVAAESAGGAPLIANRTAIGLWEKFDLVVADPTPPPTGGRPGPDNTGVPVGTPLTVIEGNQTYSASGQTISGLDIRGKVVIRGTNITLRNSIVRGPSGSSCSAGGALEVSGSNNQVENVEVAVSSRHPCLDGVRASNVTLTRMNIRGGADGLKMGSNSTLRSSWVHDLAWFSNDPTQGGGETHNDAVQILGGSNIRLESNNLDATVNGANAAVQITQDFGGVSNVAINSNWMNGGGCTLNIAHKGGPDLSVSASGNRFGRQTAFNCPILLSTRTTLVGQSNVWDDSGQPVPIQRHD